jgi:hypothetical protein
MRRLGFLALLAALPTAAAAQGGVTADLIKKGKDFYEAFQVDAARPIFQQIISPSYLNPVTLDQRVTALKYLGASYALLGSPDSAKTFFVAALDNDPFTDLGDEFSAAELGPFLAAKSEVFHVGIRQPYPAVVDPRVDSTAYRFFLVTTHSANLTVELIRLPDSTQREMLFTGPTNGLREVRWDGLIRSAGGRLADSVNYLLKVTGTSTLRRAANQAAIPPEVQMQFLRIEHSYAPLETQLPPLDSTTKLKEQIPVLAPWGDLAKGVVFGALTYGFAAITFSAADVKWQTNAIVATLVTVGSGFGSWFLRSKNRTIAAARAENIRRDSLRTVFNNAVKARNDARIAQMRLIITPLTAGR